MASKIVGFPSNASCFALARGGIYKHGIDSLDYRVSSLKNIRVVINHFDRYPLITKKLADYMPFFLRVPYGYSPEGSEP
jgi:hypothetical protein